MLHSRRARAGEDAASCFSAPIVIERGCLSPTQRISSFESFNCGQPTKLASMRPTSSQNIVVALGFFTQVHRLNVLTEASCASNLTTQSSQSDGGGSDLDSHTQEWALPVGEERN
ncbi:hypothetical protein CC2G_007161 [Coprinopsis cinerea AmutBmut pab1-1]|nr:hypothetical protein CC2G_007161 [Coprinopsis cinerea AmutBmut pab1-1]